MTQVDPAKLLKEYEKKGYNILTPSITLEGLSPHHHPTIETLTLSAILDNGDVYPHESSKAPIAKQKFRIAKQGLDKLAVLAGIIWHQQGGSVRVDDRKDRQYVAFEAFGAIRKADGQLVPVKAFYDLDFIIIKEDLEANYRSKGGKGQYAKKGQELEDYVTFCVDRDMRSKMRHRATLCESGARNRVIRSLLGIKKVYTGLELEKPFVCVRITYQPDYDDPEVKRIITMASLGSMANVYGLPAPPPQGQLPAPEAYKPVEDDDTQDGETVEMEPNGVTEEPPRAEDLPADSDDDLPDDFENWDRPSQEKGIAQAAKEKSYDLADLLKRMKKKIGELSEAQLLSLWVKLLKLEDKSEDDIPF